jgi:hypothetical protein
MPRFNEERGTTTGCVGEDDIKSGGYHLSESAKRKQKKTKQGVKKTHYIYVYI